MTERDIAVLEAVHKYRMLERRQLQEMFFIKPGARSQNLTMTVTRLNYLYRYGFLERIQRKGWWGRPNPGPAYRLAKKGAQILAERQGLEPGQVAYWGKGDDIDWHPTRVGPHYIDHALLLADVRLMVEKAAMKSGCSIDKWIDQVDLLPTWKQERVTIELLPKRVKEDVPVTPDGYFSLITPHGKGHFFLEADRGTETIWRAWQRKILAYKEYFLSGKFAKRYGAGTPSIGFRVLVVAPSAKRVVNLKGAAEKYGPPEAASLFLLAPVGQIRQDMLRESIWARGGATDAQAVL